MSRFHFHHTRLPNGLTVIGEYNPSAQSVAAGYFVNTGARDERPHVAGVSHFLEHMTFKGTARRAAEAINLEFDAMGARSNAYTSEEHTVYFGSVLPEYTGQLLDLLSDMMRPALREEDFQVEKKVILEEIAMYQDMPNFRVFDLGNPLFFRDHPLGNSVLGTTESIGNLSRDDMLAYFRERYAPNNLLLVLAGAYDWDAVLTQVQALTEQWQPSEVTREYPDLAAASGDETVTDPKVRRSHIGIWAPGPSAQSELRYAAAILANVLGDSSGSRLYWALVDRGLADTAQLWHDAGDHAGHFGGYLSTSPERTAEVLARAKEVLAGARERIPDDDEWERARNKMATAVTLQAETPFGRFMSLGNSYIMNGVYLSQDELLRRIMGATREQAQEVLAADPFERTFTLTLGPASGGLG